MILGAHVFLWTDHFTTADLVALIERLHDLDLDALEVPVGDDVRLEPAVLGRAARDAGRLLVLSPGGEWPADCDLSLPDPALRRQGIDWHRRQVDLGAACGAVAYTGALYGHPGRVVRAPQTTAERDWIAEGLRELAEHAAAAGVVLALEPMSHFRTHVANTPGQALELIRLAGHANLRLLFDTYHACTEVTGYATALREALPLLWGLHACENNRGAPGTGFLPWAEITGTLRQARWQGYVGLESYNSSCRNGEFAVARGMFHHVCPDGDAFVRQSLAFLRPQLGLAS